ncbi:glycosyltransferase family 4 protein [Pelagicoccus sp. SDUM812005]|uniref:glycosyltransferase family 4 protein n=1 Tax=Pelagicoccus sp. SDUM812005 TaxID=3041257 RepID=UPI002810984C|nr:glycosyltransferase family 4 protein [Pelagicoccus sp. SDUM812005]MDQ8181988.1 glycosyltransferase family 4 protein [Pelagicoccus sp. SDUM812005]
MEKDTSVRRVAFVADYFPRQCGIATFTHDLRKAVAGVHRGWDCSVVAVDDEKDVYDYPEEVRYQLSEQDMSGYRRAADYIQFRDTDVVCLQHEFGIFGGPDGSHVLSLMRSLKVPIVSTLHTVLEKPTEGQERVFREVLKLSTRLVVMSEKARRMLVEIWGVSPERIDVIPHGIPDMPFVDPNFYKEQFGIEGRRALLTFGLLSPGKGIESAIRALPSIVKEHPDVVYIVLGATHPNLVREQGESYRLGLERLAEKLGVKEHVIFYDRFVELEELTEFIGAADIYLTPYLNEAQITSGTLAYSFGCGKAVVSTPYWHAAELLADGRGELVPFGDSDAIAKAVNGLLSEETRLHAMRRRAYRLGRDMVWPEVGRMYGESFRKARESAGNNRIRKYATRTLSESRMNLPALNLDHLERMSDGTGLVQHAAYGLPRYEEGYCVDDNARGLLLCQMLADQDDSELAPRVAKLMNRYAAFVNYAFNPAKGRFRNFMSYERAWLEEAGSDDSHARTLWSLGAIVGRSRDREMVEWATQLFEESLPAVEDMTSPRSWAFALLGIDEYMRRLEGDRAVQTMRRRLLSRLIDLYQEYSDTDWRWFEPQLAYDNASLSRAVIVSSSSIDDEVGLDIGLRSLRWLVDEQKSETGNFRPIGSNGFYPKGGRKAVWDQQPLEAQATVQACVDAYRTTGDDFWRREARTAFDWFLGQNDSGQSLYHPKSGGCFDGLMIDRVNQNRGAESTLAYLISLVELRGLENELGAFDEVASTAGADVKQSA